MDGAKSVTDTADVRKALWYVWRFVRAEALWKQGVDLINMRILAVVRSEQSESLCHRKGKGSLTM